MDTKPIVRFHTELQVTVDEKQQVAYVSGLAAPYNKRSVDLGGFTERFAPGAFDGVLSADCHCFFNHDHNHVLGRTRSGTLKLWTGPDGLWFRVALPNTVAGGSVGVGVNRGDISGCSIICTHGRRSWNADYTELTVHEVKYLYEVGPVVWPAFPDTQVILSNGDRCAESYEVKQPCPTGS